MILDINGYWVLGIGGGLLEIVGNGYLWILDINGYWVLGTGGDLVEIRGNG
ncbi:hypothetical protein MMU07_06945 [Aquiflexum sp. LQ15W]|uniref:hypothetical protein n=1 Tax=Cognataquiflexum nitidum TaxID=2922272 RepID=UPI001F1441D2|nr:hypothetical protein [Cognataquiflexum nitidum]MCH6199306.1 hypothetical protein [Cognataquiflexum nitidum]